MPNDKAPATTHIPPDTNVAYNPYPTKSGNGKFYLARVGKKITGTKPLTQRFATEYEATNWINETVADFERRYHELGQQARQLDPKDFAAASIAFQRLGSGNAEALLALVQLWDSWGRPAVQDIHALSQCVVAGSYPAATIASRLTKALQFFQNHSPDAEQHRSVEQVIEEWVNEKSGRKAFREAQAKEKRTEAAAKQGVIHQGASNASEPTRDPKQPGLSDYARGIRCVGRKLVAAFPNRFFHELTTDELEEWLLAQSTCNNTLRHYHHDLRTVWNWAMKRRYARINPWRSMELPKKGHITIGILSCRHALALLLEAAKPANQSLLPSLVLALFAGVRSKELERLTWEDIRLHTKKPLVNLNWNVAKTCHRRWIYLPENAVKWLELIPANERTGRIRPSRWSKLFPTLRASAGVTHFPRNACRHSFASYHAAVFGIVKTTEFLGHTELRMIKEHYLEFVTQEAGEAFWKLEPKTTLQEVEQWLRAA